LRDRLDARRQPGHGASAVATTGAAALVGPLGPDGTRRLVGPPSDAGWWAETGGSATSAMADPRSFQRALRPLQVRVASPDRWRVDEDATAERLADGGVGIPVRQAETEARYEIHLVVDDSPSMTLWLDVVPALVDLLEQASLRDVRVSYLNTAADHSGGVTLRSARGDGATRQSATALADPSGRRIVWVVTDTLGPAWRADMVAPALHAWARTGPVALVNLLPERVWRWGNARAHLVRMLPPRGGAGGPGPWWRFSKPWGRPLSGLSAAQLARAVPVPMVELSPGWLGLWAEMVGRDRATDLAALLTGPAPWKDDPEAGGKWPPSESLPVDAPTAQERVRLFRRFASPAAFELATLLAAAPLSWPVVRVVLGLMPSADRGHLSEVLAGGLMRSVGAAEADGPANEIVFEIEQAVRLELMAYGSKSDALRVLRAAADALGDVMDARRYLGAVLTSARPESVEIPPVTARNLAFLAVEEAVLASVGGRFLRRSRALGAAIGIHQAPSPDGQRARPTGAADRPEGMAVIATSMPSGAPPFEITDSVRGMTMSNDIASGHTPTPRPDPDNPAAAGLARPRAASSAGGQEFVTPTTAIPATGTAPSTGAGAADAAQPRRGEPGWPVILGAIPQRNPHFTGRGGLLHDLHRQLGEGATAVVPQALYGMGGVGKSQLAIEYVYRYQNEYELVWWIPAEHNTQIVQALVDLAQAMRLNVGAEANTALPAVREALRTGKPYGRWLLVFDNAEDPDSVLEYFPTAGSEGRVLVTSRDTRWASRARSLEVAVFTRPESMELLQRRNESLSNDEADRLAEALGDLPLAIEQAATWRVETGMPADEYLELLETKIGELMGDDDEVSEPTGQAQSSARRPEQSVTAAWSVSLDRIGRRNPAALRLLQVCAFFAPERISRQMFTLARSTMIVPELDTALRDPIALSRAIREVTRYSLLKLDHRTNSFQMHRLVQKVLVDRMTSDERETMRRGAQALLATSDPADPVSQENWPRYAELYPHVLAADAVHSKDPWPRDLVLNEVRYLYQWGEHEAARELAQHAYDVWTETLGPEHRQTIDVGGWLSFMLFLLGEFTQAAQLNAQQLEICTRVYGQDHETTLDALGAVAADRRVQGDFAAGHELSRQAYERYARSLGEDDPQTLQAAHNLAVALRLLGRFTDARDLAAATLESSELLFGPDAPTCLVTRNGINTDQRELGEVIEALYQQEELVDKCRQVYGPRGESHPNLLRAARNLSSARRRAGEHQKALEVSLDVRRRFATRYDADYPDTLAASLCLTTDLRCTGSLAEARDLGQDTLDRYRRVLGNHHPHTVAALVNLAVTLRLAGEVTIAFQHDTDAVAALRTAVGKEHPLYLVAATNLASDHYALGEFQAAHDLDADVAEHSARLIGVRHPNTLAVRANLAMDLRALGRTNEAEDIHTDTLRAMGEVLGIDHPATRNAAAWVRSDLDIDPMPL